MNAEKAFHVLKQETLTFCDNMLEMNKDNDQIIIDKRMFKNFKWFVSLQEISSIDDSFGDDRGNSR